MEISGKRHTAPFSPMKKPLVFHNKKVGELRNKSGRFGEKKISCPCWKLYHIFLIIRLLAYALYRLSYSDKLRQPRVSFQVSYRL